MVYYIAFMVLLSDIFDTVIFFAKFSLFQTLCNYYFHFLIYDKFNIGRNWLKIRKWKKRPCRYSLLEKCPYWELFWAVYSNIWTEYG